MLQVSIRVRPLLPFEKENHWFINANSIQSKSKKFTFDSIETQSKTLQLYNKIAQPIVQKALSGYHATILCYGQTTSGKTFTTLGVHDNPGLLPCALREIFQHSSIKVHLQYIQIYNESIDDLLDSGQQQLKIVDDPHYGSTVHLQKHRVKDFQQAIQLLNAGEEKRIYRSNQINEHSSRSHTIFKIYIENDIHYSCLNIVDLAGSERISDISNYETGYINKSLLSLTNVINQLSEQKQHISFRDSKLTRLLSNSLGGNAYTLLICCVSPGNVGNTQSTLQFAQRAKKVENTPIENIKTINNNNTNNTNNNNNQQDENKENIQESIINFFQRHSKSFSQNQNYTKILQFESQFINKYNQILSEFKQQLNSIQDQSCLNIINKFQQLTKTVEKPQQFHYQGYTWGSGQDGRLGQGDEKSQKIPMQINGIQFKQIVCGYHHTLGLSDGFVYSWGRGQRGQLGHEDCQNQYAPTKIQHLANISSIACGWQHSLALQDNGSLYSWGYGEDGQLGDGECVQRNSPIKIEEGVHSIYAGHSHSGFMKDGMLYTFGNNQDGRCMIDYLGILGQPEQVPLNDIVNVSLGVSHMGVVTKDGNVYMAGTSTDGQLGCYSSNDEVATWFTQVDKFNANNRAIKIACGDCYSLVLNSRQMVFAFGKSTYRRLGLPTNENIYEPTVIKLGNVKEVIAGCRHAGVITNNDDLYLWGFNFHHQIGLKDDDNDQDPIRVLQNVKQVSLGYFHSVALI